MIKQTTKIVVLLVLAMGLTANSAMAQGKDEGFAPVGIYTGIETRAATCDLSNEMCYGNTFVLESHGEWENHQLTVSLNYSTAQFYPTEFIVTGGSWSLVVLHDNQYSGTLYGSIQSGSLGMITNSRGDEIAKRIRVNLASGGGFGSFAGRPGHGIYGVYDMMTDLRSTNTSGVANFTF